MADSNTGIDKSVFRRTTVIKVREELSTSGFPTETKDPGQMVPTSIVTSSQKSQ